jgi:uncharacterized protein YceH (UPF0502 family)
MQLHPIELRVLGSLIEKEIATPENYPLSLNALVNACNQRSSRDPVLDLTEEEVRQALHSLEDQSLVTPVRDSRVPKYEHRVRTVLNLRRDETAILCLLLLRGPQTPGELRSRADRLYTFDDLGAVISTLERLASRPSPEAGQPSTNETTGPLTVLLPRQPGSREARYAHLLGPLPDISFAPPENSHKATEHDRIDASGTTLRLSQLEAEVSLLTAAVQELQTRVDQLQSKVQTGAQTGESS